MKVCLIVDNPLRDLDGLVLVAWHLAAQGVEAFLVPMYNQAFDVHGIKPDFVLANYARPNNAELLKRFYLDGIKIGILDSEGSPAMPLESFAKNVKNVGCSKFIDLYFLWGKDQYDAFVRNEVLPESRMRLSGCPRYDFCSEKWRKALNNVDVDEPYILINTRFPAVNPRFTAGSDEEKKTMVHAGFDADWVDNFIRDSKVAYKMTLEVIDRLAETFSDIKIIIRPHPFENIFAYKKLLRHKNVEIKQVGTSLEWINSAKVLIHQNCLTSIEAVMLGREPISLDWFNTEALLEEGSRSISHNANSQMDLERLIADILGSRDVAISQEMLSARKNIIFSRYYTIDGNSALRVAKSIVEFLKNTQLNLSCGKNKKALELVIKVSYKQIARRVLGFKFFRSIRCIVEGRKGEGRRNAKLFSLEDVQNILARIKLITPNISVVASYIENNDMLINRMCSRETIKISRK